MESNIQSLCFCISLCTAYHRSFLLIRLRPSCFTKFNVGFLDQTIDLRMYDSSIHFCPSLNIFWIDHEPMPKLESTLMCLKAFNILKTLAHMTGEAWYDKILMLCKVTVLSTNNYTCPIYASASATALKRSFLPALEASTMWQWPTLQLRFTPQLSQFSTTSLHVNREVQSIESPPRIWTWSF